MKELNPKSYLLDSIVWKNIKGINADNFWGLRREVFWNRILDSTVSIEQEMGTLQNVFDNNNNYDDLCQHLNGILVSSCYFSLQFLSNLEN